MEKIDALLAQQHERADGFLPLDASRTMLGCITFKPFSHSSTPLDLREGTAQGDALLLSAGGFTAIGSGAFPQKYYLEKPSGYTASTDVLALGAGKHIDFVVGYDKPENARYMQLNESGALVPLKPKVGLPACSIGTAATPWDDGYFQNLTVASTIAGNAATTSKLRQAVKINGVTFDGSSDITISTADSTKLPLAGGTMAGQIKHPGQGSNWIDGGSGKVGVLNLTGTPSDSSAYPLLRQKVTSGAFTLAGYQDAWHISYFTNENINSSTNTRSCSYKFQNDGTLVATKFSGALNGNATTASALAASRSFSITGGATAAAISFNGNGNVALNVTALDISKANAGTLPVGRGGTGNTTGNAATATKLATARSVHINLGSANAVNFDGSANISPGVTGTLPIARGGTARTSFTNGQALVGNASGGIDMRAITASPASGSSALFTAGGAYTELGKKANLAGATFTGDIAAPGLIASQGRIVMQGSNRLSHLTFHHTVTPFWVELVVPGNGFLLRDSAANYKPIYAANVGTPSSLRYKNILANTQDDKAQQLLAVQVKDFTYKKGTAFESEHVHSGLIAEELEPLLPELIYYNDGKVDGVNYSNMVPLLLKLVQVHYKELNAVKEWIKKQSH